MLLPSESFLRASVVAEGYFDRTSLHSFSKYCFGRAPMTVPVTFPFSKR